MRCLPIFVARLGLGLVISGVLVACGRGDTATAPGAASASVVMPTVAAAPAPLPSAVPAQVTPHLALGPGGGAYPAPPASTEQPNVGHPAPVSMDGPAPLLGFVIDEHRQIVSVEPGNAMERAGIHAGDTVIAIDGFTDPVKDFDAIRESIITKKEIIIKLKRKDTGKEEDVVVVPAPPQPRTGQPTITPGPPNMNYF